MENLIYVKFQSEIKHPRHQFFKEVGKEVYYGRDHFLLWHTTYTINNEMNLEMVVPKEVTFIICDNDNQEITRSSNRKGKSNFPLLRYQCLLEWNNIKENYNAVYTNDFESILQKETNSHLKKWLLSFKSEYEAGGLIYEEKTWLENTKVIEAKPEILYTFDYCGVKIQIQRIKKQHGICKRKWYEYYSGQEFVGIQIIT